MASKSDVLRRKGNRYHTGASDKALGEKGIGNVMKENKNPDTNVLGYKKTTERIDSVRKPNGTEEDKGNAMRERLDALRATDRIGDKEYKKRKKAL